MPRRTSFLVIFVLSYPGFYASNDVKPFPCPFSSQCSCWDDTNSNAEFEYSRVDCRSNTLGIPDFASPNAYSVYGPMYLGYDIADMKPGQFSIFMHIDQLYMEQRKGSSPVYQQWNETAFQNVKSVNELHVSGLAGMIPLPKALKNLGLSRLYVQDQGAPYELSNGALEGCDSLRTLELTGSVINKVDEQVFINMTQLEDINLSESGLNEAAIKALNNSSLKKSLISIDLSDNKIQTIQEGDFGDFQRLSEIDLNSNPITVMEPNAFSGSTKLQSVDFEGLQIAVLDLASFANVYSNFKLSYYSRELTNLTVSSLQNFPDHSSFDLTDTALQSVDPVIGDLLGNYSNVHINISYVKNFLCLPASWMVKAVFCSRNLRIDNIQCSDVSGTLEEYLQTISSLDPCSQQTTSLEPPTTRNTYPYTTTMSIASGWLITHDSSLFFGRIMLSIFLLALGHK